MDWDDFRYLLAIERAGSLGAAARQLRVDASTISRRLTALETALGTQLAERRPEGLVLTAAGKTAAATAAAMDELAQALASRVGGEDAKLEGTVRLATTEGMFSFVAPVLRQLAESHPKLRIDIVAGTASVDLARREADIAIRHFRDPHGALVAKKVGEFAWALYASHDYLARRGRQGLPDSLAGHDVVGFEGRLAKVPGPAWLAERLQGANVVSYGSSALSVMHTVAAGLGVSTLPCFVASPEPRLCRLTQAVAKSEVFVVIPPDHRDTARVRVVHEALVAFFEAQSGLLDP